MYQRSKAMGQEFYDVGVHIALAPVTGGPLGRAPLYMILLCQAKRDPKLNLEPPSAADATGKAPLLIRTALVFTPTSL